MIDEELESPPGASTDASEPGAASPALWLGDALVIMELAPDAVLVVDEQGRIEMANRAAEEMFGYDRARLTSLDVDTLVPDGRREAHRSHRASFATTPAMRPMGDDLDLWARHADGSEFPVQISLSPVTFGQGPRVIAIVRDITERRRQEQDTRKRLILADEERIGASLQDRVVSRLFGAGLAIEAMMSRVSPEIADRMGEVVHQIDLAVRELRESVFGVDNDDQASMTQG